MTALCYPKKIFLPQSFNHIKNIIYVCHKHMYGLYPVIVWCTLIRNQKSSNISKTAICNRVGAWFSGGTGKGKGGCMCEWIQPDKGIHACKYRYMPIHQVNSVNSLAVLWPCSTASSLFKPLHLRVHLLFG